MWNHAYFNAAYFNPSFWHPSDGSVPPEDATLHSIPFIATVGGMMTR